MSVFQSDPKTGQPTDPFAYLRSLGFQIQPQRHVRDQEEIFTTLLDAILNDISYIGKVQHLIEFYGASTPHVRKETKVDIHRAFDDVKLETPTYKTAIEPIGSHGFALTVGQSKAHGDRSHLPLNSAEHYKVFMDAERENFHMRVYMILAGPLGDVIEDLVTAKMLPRQWASKLRKPDLSDVAKAKEELDAVARNPPATR